MASESDLSCVLSDKEDYSSTKLNNYQEIKLAGDDENNIHVVNAKNVIVHTPAYNRVSSSNRVKINNIVDYGWEPKYHFGHLVAATLKGTYFAYSIRSQRIGSGVRVMKYKTEKRILIKDFKGKVNDLAFAYTQEVILACIDEFGNLEVHEIQEFEDDGGPNIRNQVLLKLDREATITSSSYHLLFWCPFIPDDLNEIVVSKDDEPNSMLLAVTHNKEVEVINVRLLAHKFGSTPILSRQLPHNMKILIRNPKEVTVATFSPDGTAIATGSLEGDVYFYEVKEAAFENDEVPSWIHEWKPHGGKPISTLFFLDNHKIHQPEIQFWKFALTGTEYNQEIKLWSCLTWDCLQTIRFSGPVELELKAELDSTGGYLLLSDLSNKSVYVLQIFENNNDCAVNICSIAEFPMTHSILSIAPVEAIKCRVKITDEIEPSKKSENGQYGEDEEEEDSSKELSVKGISIRCFWISTKSLQECRITYHPPIMVSYQADDTISLMSQDSNAYRDHLSELGIEMPEEPPTRPEVDNVLKLQNRTSSLSDREDLLLTPDDFASPSHTKPIIGLSPALTKFPPVNTSLTPSSVPLPPISPSEEINLNSSVSSISSMNNNLGKRLSQSFGNDSSLCLKSDDLMLENEEPLATSESLIRRKLSQRSSGSSPSQEVADIMEPVKTSISDLVNIPSQTNGVLPTMGNSPPLVPTKSKPDSEILIGGVGTHQDFGSWPQAPDLSKVNEFKLISQTTEKPSFANPSLLAAQNSLINHRPHEDTDQKLSKIEQSLINLTIEISGLSTIRQHQNLEIQSLKQHDADVQSLMQQQLNKLQEQTRYFQTLNHRLDKLEGGEALYLQKALSEQSRLDHNKMESLMSRRETMDRQCLEKTVYDLTQNATSLLTQNLNSTLTQNIAPNLSMKIDKTIKNEIKTVVLPNMTKVLEGWRETLQQDLVQRTSMSENSIKEHFSKLLKNKAFIDSIAQNVSINVQPQIQAICRDLLQSYLVPTFEKLCKNLFAELNEAFKRGTKEYLLQTESTVERSHQQTLASVGQKLQDQTTQLNKTKDLMMQSSNSMSSINDSLLLRLRPAIAEEMRLVLAENSPSQFQNVSADNGGILSRTMTPVPKPIDAPMIKSLITNNLRDGQYNAAFQQALNAADLGLVMFVCESVTAKKVFGQVPCPLKQHVILSLIHQLGSNLNDNIDLKISYLEEALMTLDPTDPLTNNHLPSIIEQLRTRLGSFLQLNPNTGHMRKIKMILMASNSLTYTS